MRKRPSPVLDYLVYLAVRTIVTLLQIVSPGVALSWMRRLAQIAYRVDRRHREVARDNLQHAFPGRYTDAELDGLIHRVYEHFAMMILETALMPRKLGPIGLRDLACDEESWARFDAVCKSGKPIVLVTGHFGNWELAAPLVARLGKRAHLVARPMDNPYLDEMMREFRERNGHKLLSKNGDAKLMWDVLADGGTVCTLADQDAGQNGLFVNFFGRPASTHRGIAMMAVKNGAIVVVGGLRNRGGILKYTAYATDVIYPHEYDGSRKSVLDVTQRLTSAIERHVRLDPHQYFWLHRRWKHQPKTGVGEAA
jgi:KDO2-lipid IV(A) lauroyltransferase